MREFTYDCRIDGQSYSLELLALVRYQRDIHVLHELKRAGATVQFEGKSLSDDDVDLLSAEEAFTISADVRRSYDLEGIKSLFGAQLKASEQRWRDLNAASDGMPLQVCVADITITGISFDEFAEAMKTQAPFLDDYPALHPDHFFIEKDGETIKGIETFGMYGGPSEMWLSPVPNLSVPIERDESYPFAFGAVATLPNGINSNVPAFMQFKSLENGLIVKAGCCFPAKSPIEMVEGHKLHLALEFLGFAKAIAAR